MNPKNFFMKKPNVSQGYQILYGTTLHSCGDPNTELIELFEWALIDRGAGKSPCVAHYVFAEGTGEWNRENDDIVWSHGHYFNTIEEAEVYYLERVEEELQIEIEDLKERLGKLREHLREARYKLPKEEE